MCRLNHALWEGSSNPLLARFRLPCLRRACLARFPLTKPSHDLENTPTSPGTGTGTNGIRLLGGNKLSYHQSRSWSTTHSWTTDGEITSTILVDKEQNCHSGYLIPGCEFERQPRQGKITLTASSKLHECMNAETMLNTTTTYQITS